MYFTICYSPHNSLMPHLTRLKMSVTSPASRTGFLYLSHNTSLLWGCPLYCRMFSSIPPLGMPLEASNSPCTNSHDNQPFPIIFCKIKLPLVENPCSRDTCAYHPCWGFPGGSDGKKSASSAEVLCLIPGWGRSPGEGNGYPLQYSYLENSTDRAWWAPPLGSQRVRHGWATNTFNTFTILARGSKPESWLVSVPGIVLWFYIPGTVLFFP